MAFAQYSPTQPAVARDSEPTVVQVMHRGVVTCSVDASTRSLAVRLRQHGIHHVIVVEGKEPVGVISEDDLLRAGNTSTSSAPSSTRPRSRFRSTTPGKAASTCSAIWNRLEAIKH